jgi:hypothetical protein
VTERPHNVRSARTLERTHNSRRHQAESTWDDTQSIASRGYRGSHRAERMHRADDVYNAAFDRSSRVGRHHADRHPDHSNRW